MPYQAEWCHFGDVWQWKPIHNWSRDRLNLEPVPPCAPPTQLELAAPLLLCNYSKERGGGWGGGGGEKVCILQIFRGHHTTQLLRVRLKGSDDMTGVWSHLTVWETSARQTRVSDHLLSQHFFSFKEGRKKRLQVNLKACSHQCQAGL